MIWLFSKIDVQLNSAGQGDKMPVSWCSITILFLLSTSKYIQVRSVLPLYFGPTYISSQPTLASDKHLLSHVCCTNNSINIVYLWVCQRSICVVWQWVASKLRGDGRGRQIEIVIGSIYGRQSNSVWDIQGIVDRINGDCLTCTLPLLC